MLGGLAMKWKWRQRREAAGQDATRPNLVLGSNVQVVWEKFCRYWDVEPRYVPVEKGRYVDHARRGGHRSRREHHRRHRHPGHDVHR